MRSYRYRCDSREMYDGAVEYSTAESVDLYSTVKITVQYYHRECPIKCVSCFSNIGIFVHSKSYLGILKGRINEFKGFRNDRFRVKDTGIGP